MASRLKEDEKNERIIRSLLKQPANRKCLNCNSLGPQYVCTTFWTFVCTTCSGIHREFTHRVKSVSMAKFTPEEVSSLQSGGNECAKEIYFKELDSHRLPDSSNVDKLRDFIKHVYVNRRYTGERGNDRPPRVKMGEKEEPYDYRKTDSYRSGSRSPPYEDTYERRYSDRPSPGYEGRRSPGYEQDNRFKSDYGRSPVRSGSGVVNDWRREDRFGNVRRSEDLRSSEGDSKSGGRSPDSQKDLNVSSSPVIRPVRDILGENAAPLRVIEPPRVSSGKMSEGSAHTQRTASSSSLASSNGNPPEVKREDSLINFDDDPEPPAAVATQPTQLNTSLASNTTSENWACFDNAPESKVSQPPTNMNTLDSVLTQLSAPSSASASASAVPTYGGAPAASPSNSATTPVITGDSLFFPTAQVSVTPSNGTAPAAPPTINASLFTPNGAYAAASNSVTLQTNSTGTSVSNFASFPAEGATQAIPGTSVSISGQWSNMRPQNHSVYLVSGSQLTASQFSSSVTGPSSSQGLPAHPVTQMSQAGVVPGQASSGIAAQRVEVKTDGRKELPADLFTAMYAPQPVHAPGWMTGFAPGMAFSMQYNTAMPMPTLSHSTKSINPFDVSSESSSAQAPAFPSMMPLQAALPNMGNTTGLGHTPCLDSVMPSWMPSQASPYPSVTPQLTPPFATAAVTSGSYMSQQVPSNLAPRPQGFGAFGNDVAGFSSMNPALDLGGGLSAPAAPSPSGNPFG